MNIMKIINIMNIMGIMIIMNIMNITNIMDIMNTTALKAMAGDVSVLVSLNKKLFDKFIFGFLGLFENMEVKGNKSRRHNLLRRPTYCSCRALRLRPFFPFKQRG